MSKNKVKVKDTLENFLFNQIQNDPEFIEFASTYEIPTYITENISRTLRPYQEDAIKSFIFLFEKDKVQANICLDLRLNILTKTEKTFIV